MQIPNDPFILFSFINTQLRDTGMTLRSFCAENELDADAISEKLKKAGFRYDDAKRCFR
ncbi:MAG: DUF4250 domain-containing protein [Oscillospiraceae bacterium]|nr:DUF4250 domain-containing protein [Oscillospiraceae bacterium]